MTARCPGPVEAPLHREGGQAQFIVRPASTGDTATLEPLLAWIEEHAHEPLTLGDLAAAAHTSVRSLNRRFHQETGVSPMQWVTAVRIRHAQELLETTDHAVERVARQVGFPSVVNFRAQFRRSTGVAPSQYRATFRGQCPGACPLVQSRRWRDLLQVVHKGR